MTYQKKSTGPFSMTEELRSALQIWGSAIEGDEDADDVVTEALNRISQPVAALQHAQAALRDKEIDLIMVTNGFPNTRPTAAFRSFARAILAAGLQPAAVVPLQTYEAMRSARDHYQELYEQSAAPAIQVQEGAALEFSQQYTDGYTIGHADGYAACERRSIKDERLAFENWITAAFDECGEDEPNLELDANGRYTNDMRVLTGWQIWQARAALAAPAPVQPAPVVDAARNDAVRDALQMLYDDRAVIEIITVKQAQQIVHALYPKPLEIVEQPSTDDNCNFCGGSGERTIAFDGGFDTAFCDACNGTGCGLYSQGRAAGIEQAAKKIESNFIGYRDDDKDLAELALTIRALAAKPSEEV